MNEKLPTNSVEFGPVLPQGKEAIKNIQELAEKLYYATSGLTQRSQFARSEEEPEGKERPIFLRNRRARLYKELEEIPTSERGQRHELLNQAKRLDAITEQYLNPRDITVNLPEYGEQSARTVDISLEATDDRPPVFVIPGLSNDVECVSNLLVEIALQGRRVVCVGYPESFLGKTTEEFAGAVEADPGFAPHIAFYKAAIEGIFGKNEEIEIWGYSTGAPIASGILKDADFQERTDDAVLLFPAATVDQSLTSLKIGLVHDLGSIKNQFNRFAAFFWGTGQKDKEAEKLHDRILDALLIRITKEDADWKDACVREGGTIAIVSGDQDDITKSAKADFSSADNPQVVSGTISNAYHHAPQTEPERVVVAVFALQNKA